MNNNYFNITKINMLLLPKEKDPKVLSKEMGIAMWMEETQMIIKTAKASVYEDGDLDIKYETIDGRVGYVEVKSAESMNEIHGITGASFNGQIAYIDSEFQNQSSYNKYTAVPEYLRGKRFWLINNRRCDNTIDFKFLPKWLKLLRTGAWLFLICNEHVYIFDNDSLQKAFECNVYFNSYTDYLNRPKNQKKKWNRKALINLDKALKVYKRETFEPFFEKAMQKIIYWKQCDDVC